MSFIIIKGVSAMHLIRIICLLIFFHAPLFSMQSFLKSSKTLAFEKAKTLHTLMQELNSNQANPLITQAIEEINNHTKNRNTFLQLNNSKSDNPILQKIIEQIRDIYAAFYRDDFKKSLTLLSQLEDQYKMIQKIKEILTITQQLTQTEFIKHINDNLNNIMTFKPIQHKDISNINNDTSELMNKLFAYTKEIEDSIMQNDLQLISKKIDESIKKASALLVRKKRMIDIINLFKNNDKLAQLSTHSDFEQSVSTRNMVDDLKKKHDTYKIIADSIIKKLNDITIPEHSYLWHIKNAYNQLPLTVQFDSSPFDHASYLLSPIVNTTKELFAELQKESPNIHIIKEFSQKIIAALDHLDMTKKQIIQFGEKRFLWSKLKSYDLREIIKNKKTIITPELQNALDDYEHILKDPLFEQKADSLKTIEQAITVIKNSAFPNIQAKETTQEIEKTEQKITSLKEQLIQKKQQLRKSTYQQEVAKANQEIHIIEKDIAHLSEEKKLLEKNVIPQKELAQIHNQRQHLDALIAKEKTYENKIDTLLGNNQQQIIQSFSQPILAIQQKIKTLTSNLNQKSSTEFFDKTRDEVDSLFEAIDLFSSCIEKTITINKIIEEMQALNITDLTQKITPLITSFTTIRTALHSLDTAQPTPSLLAHLKSKDYDLTLLTNEATQLSPDSSYLQKIKSQTKTSVQKTVTTGTAVIGTLTTAKNTIADTAQKTKSWYNSIAYALTVLKKPFIGIQSLYNSAKYFLTYITSKYPYK